MKIFSSKCHGAAIITDLEGAIDATWCKGLIYKLYHSGIKGDLLILLNNFLTDRLSRNNVNGYVSKWFPTTIGLPQGSILSPILFLVYTGDLLTDQKLVNFIVYIYIFSDFLLCLPLKRRTFVFF